MLDHTGLESLLGLYMANFLFFIQSGIWGAVVLRKEVKHLIDLRFLVKHGKCVTAKYVVGYPVVCLQPGPDNFGDMRIFFQISSTEMKVYYHGERVSFVFLSLSKK